MKKMSALFVLLFAAGPAGAAVVGRNVDYQEGTTTLKGYLTYDDAVKGPRPAVLVVHEWWGQNDYARKRADMLAGLGYVALALDMYGGGKVASHPQEAGAFSQAAMHNFPEAKARFEAALSLVKKQPAADPTRVAAIGYCFGGSVVLNMAREGEDLKGVASFHGSPFAIHPAEPGKIKAKILFCTGANDKMITADQVAAFKAEMKAARAAAKVISYPGAMHSFTNPAADENAAKFNLPMAYDPKADTASWKELQSFLKNVFK